jgi:hypothetical protein
MTDASIILQLRTLQPINPATPTSFSAEVLTALSLRQRLGLVARPPEHSESEQVFTYRGQDVKVKEKIAVQSMDPSLLAVEAKLAALEHGVKVARRCLAAVMGVDEEDM